MVNTIMADSIHAHVKHGFETHFSWDIDISKEPFWIEFGPSGSKIARAFLVCCDENNLDKIKLEVDDNTSPEMKLGMLRDRIEDNFHTESAKVAPSQLRDVDYTRWRNLQAGLSTMNFCLGDFEAAESIGKQMYEHGPDGKLDMSALHAQSNLWLTMGKYAEAEAAARLVLPWLQAHPALGDENSPQALGSLKILVKSLWEQGKNEEAQVWVEQCEAFIDGMGDSKFSKYQEDERRQWVHESGILRRETRFSASTA